MHTSVAVFTAVSASVWLQTSDPRAELIALAQDYRNALSAATAFPRTGFPDRSLEAIARREAAEDALLRRLTAIDTIALRDSPELDLYHVLHERLEADTRLRVCQGALWDVDPVQGWHIHHLPRVARDQAVGTDEARAGALVRWRSLPQFVDTEITTLRAGISGGVTASRDAVEHVLAQLDDLIAAPADQSPFFQPARRDSDKAFQDDYGEVVNEAVVPALKRYREFLSGEYLQVARSTPGLASLPRGGECWSAHIRRALTVAATPEALDSTARRLLAVGVAHRDHIARERYGIGNGRMLTGLFNTDTALAFGSHAEALDTVRSLMARSAAVAPQYFGRLPAPILPLLDTVTLPSGLRGSYRGATATRPARLMLNLRDLLRPPARIVLVSTVLHEAVPGHHVQIALAPRATQTDSLLSELGYNLAFAEGWASYAASDLAYEMGLRGGAHRDAEIAILDVDYAVDMYVSSGIHLHGWSLEQALDTLSSYSADDRDFLREGVLSFITLPADNLAYSFGHIEFRRLRTEAARRLDMRFDVREFHDLLLERGQLPISILRERVEAWIRDHGMWP